MNLNNPMWDWYTRKIVYVILQISLGFLKLYVSIYFPGFILAVIKIMKLNPLPLFGIGHMTFLQQVSQD